MADFSRFDVLRVLVHPLLSAFVPFWFLLMMALVFTNSLILPAGIEIFPPMYLLLMLLTGTAAVGTGSLFSEKRKASPVHRLREFILLQIIAVFLILLFHGEAGRKDFNIGRVKIWLPALLLGGQWFLSVCIHRLLQKRERFLSLCDGKEAKESLEIYKAHMHEGSNSLKALESVKRLLIALVAIGFTVCLVASWILGIHYSGLSFAVILFFFLSFTLIIATLNTWRSAQLLMADGCMVRGEQQRFRMIVAVSLTVVALLIAFFLTGRRPLFAESYLEAVLGLLERLGGIEFENRAAEPPVFDLLAMGNRIDSYLRAVESQQPKSSKLFAMLNQVAGWAILGLIGAATAVFLFVPLFRYGSSDRGAAQGGFYRIVMVIRNARKIIGASRCGFRRKRKRLRFQKGWKRFPVSETAMTAGSATHLPAKTKIERGKMRKAFFRFVKWGERQGIGFSYNSGPLEYALKVAAAVPGRADGCKEIARLFEEAMYSNHKLKKECYAGLSKNVRKMIKIDKRSVLWKS